MKLVLVGTNHKTAPVEIRERMSLSEDEARETLRLLIREPWIDEAFLLSTCNRTEYLIYGRHFHRCVESALSCMFGKDKPDDEELDKWIYVLQEEEAVRHLFRVASSMDSMVVGEPQILGQVKEAYRLALNVDSCGAFLNRLMHHAFRVAKRVRTNTGIGRSAVSVSYAAVELAKNIFQDLQTKTILLIGAGEMIELAVSHFVQNGIKRILVANRTISTAEQLAMRFGGKAYALEELSKVLPMADIVLSCTSSQQPIIGAEEIRMAMKMRRSRAMFLIDIAVPRDVDPAVNDVENVYLYDIDDLQDVVSQNVSRRQTELETAQQIVDQEVEKFVQWRRAQRVVPSIKGLTLWAEEIRRGEIQKTLNSLGELTEQQRSALDAMTKAIVKKILHRPISRLKEIQDLNEDGHLIESIKKLFDLE